MPRLALDPNVADPNKVSSAEQTLEQIGTASNDDSTLIGAKARGQKPAQAVAGCYIVSQRPAIKLMSDVKRTSYMQMVPHRWKMDARFKADDIIWRKDMDTFVLDLMRKKVVKLLKYLSSKPAAYVAKCEDYENIQSKHQPGAVLWLGESNGNAVSKINHEPSPYAMVKYRSACQIPVYNIPALLGPDCLGQLRDSSEPFKNTLVVIKQKRNTLETLMHLWKMMGYMASNTDPGQQAHVD